MQGGGEQLPFADGSFDGAFCCLSIEHTDDPDEVLAEVGRVLAPGGRFLLLINHPIHQGPDSGFIDDRILGERYWRVGPYLKEAVTVEEVDADVSIPFSHRPLNRYINPLAEQGFLVMTAMFEPPPLEEFLKGSIEPEFEAWIPRLLAMRFERRPPVWPRRHLKPESASDDLGSSGRIRRVLLRGARRAPRGGGDGRVPDSERALRCGSLERRRDDGGSRLVRDRQPAAGTHRSHRRARR